MENITLPRMRTIPQTVRELKELDKDTAMNEHCLRKLIADGTLPHVRSGRKIFVCLDTVFEYMAHPENLIKTDYTGLRKIKE